MDPRDEIAWFQAISPTYVSLNQNTATQLVKADANRVGLMLGWNGTGANVAFVAPDPGIPISGTPGGWQLTVQNPNLMLLQRDWGVIVQSEWWSFTTSANQLIMVVELRLRDWPKGGGNARGQGILRSGDGARVASHSGPELQASLADILRAIDRFRHLNE